jgi:predicted Zn-dependent protease
VDLLAASGRAREAAGVIERAVRLAPDSPRHLALVGEVRLATHDGAEAEKALRRALDLAPDSAAVRLALGRALLMQQKPAEAIATLNSAAPSPDRDILLGSAYSARREWDRAIQHLQRALDAGRSTPDVLNALAWATLQAGRREEAAGVFARSLAARPDQPEIRRVLDSIRRGTWRPDQ